MTKLVVGVAEIARRADLDAADTRTRHVVEQAILDEQAAVETYLGQPIIPRTYTDTERAPAGGRWHLVHYPVVEVLEVVPETDVVSGEPTGLYSVTYRAGLDASNPDDGALDPIRRYVAQQVLLNAEVRRLRQARDPSFDRTVASVSVEGQTVSYEKSSTGAGAASGGSGGKGGGAGGLALQSLDYWRVAGRRTSTGQGRRRLL